MIEFIILFYEDTKAIQYWMAIKLTLLIGMNDKAIQVHR